MIFGHFLLNVNEANAFLLGCDETKEAILVDAGEFDPAIREFADQHGLNVTTVFITHDHFDHDAGVAAAAQHFGAEIVSGSNNPAGCSARAVRHGDEIKIGNLLGKFVATPGHTPDGMSLILPGMVFTGDALFAGSVGGTSTPDSFEQQINHIRDNIFSLPPDYEIHTGHGPSSTIAIESAHNPFFN